MKKLLLILTVLLFSTQTYAQRIAFIESEYILSKVPDYKAANDKLDKISEKWKKDIDDQMEVLDMMYKKFQAEQSLYTEKMRQENIRSIEDKEKQIASQQQERFGPNGELFKKRQQMIKPIMDKMMTAIKNVAKRKSFDLVLDKSTSSTIMFSNDRLNISEEVLKQMTY